MKKINSLLSNIWKILLAIGGVFLMLNLSKSKKQAKKQRKNEIDLIDEKTKNLQREAVSAKENKNISDLSDDTDSMLVDDDNDSTPKES